MRTLLGLTLSWTLFLPLLFSEVRQAHVDPRTITLPVVDGKGIRFTRLSTDEGLSQTKVTHMVQDDQGFMWFGTQYGLNRTTATPSNCSFAIREIPTLRIAMARSESDAINFSINSTETFTRYPVPFVTHISQDSAGTLWLATVKGLYSLDPAAGTVRQYSHNPNDPSSLSNNDVKSSGEDKQGRFWVATIGHLDEFDRRTGKVTRHIPIPGAPLGFEFYEDRFDVFWIFHDAPNALSVLNRKTNNLTNYSFHDLETPTTGLTVIMAMTEDRNGTLVACNTRCWFAVV